MVFSTNESVLLTLSRAYHVPNHVTAPKFTGCSISIQTFITGAAPRGKGYSATSCIPSHVKMEKMDTGRAHQP